MTLIFFIGYTIFFLLNSPSKNMRVSQFDQKVLSRKFLYLTNKFNFKELFVELKSL